MHLHEGDIARLVHHGGAYTPLVGIFPVWRSANPRELSGRPAKCGFWGLTALRPLSRYAASGPLAQLVEQLTFNQWVAGSNPARLTTEIIYLDGF